jgi:Tol biopolymer transport system component
LAAAAVALLLAGNGVAQAKSVDIVFLRKGDIYRMHSDGSGVKRLTKTSAQESAVAWSPDHKSIVFVRQTDMFSDPPIIYRMPAGGGKATRVIYSDNVGSPSWHSIDSLAYSPDGTKLAFGDELSAGSNASEGRVCVIDLVAGTCQALFTKTLPTDLSFTVSWSPDGKMIVAAEPEQDDENGPVRLITVATDHVAVLPISGASNAVWSPSGSRLLVSLTSPSNSRIAIYKTSGARVKTLATGAGSETVAKSKPEVYGAAFSADGKHVVYVKTPGPTQALWVMSSTGTGKHRINKDGDGPAWR